MLTTPNTNSFFSKILKGKWQNYDGIEHIQLFHNNNLQTILETVDFNKLKTAVYSKKLELDIY